MHLLEGIEEVARQSIAKAVLQDEHAATVVCAGLDTGDSGVATHEGAIGGSAAVFEVMEENALMWAPHTDDTVVFVNGVIDVGRAVGDIAWHVIDEVLWGVLHGNILRITVHVANKAVNYFAVVVR